MSEKPKLEDAETLYVCLLYVVEEKVNKENHQNQFLLSDTKFIVQ